MNILQELENFISEFNQDNNEDFEIDSIRVEFQKQHKKEALEELGEWSKMKKNSNILHKLKKRSSNDEVTSAWSLRGHSIYYYNIQDAPKYRRAALEIFGMKQYHKAVPPRELITKVLSVMKNVSNIDVCLDLPYKPNVEGLSRYFTLTPYITNDGLITDTSYINDTGIPMIEKITIYNKAHKNLLKSILWRIEAKISIPNFKALALPLHEFKEIIDIVRVSHD